MNPLLQLAITEAPRLIEWMKLIFKRDHPGLPEPTDAEVIAAWQEALASSLAKDDNWLSVHPPKQ